MQLTTWMNWSLPLLERLIVDAAGVYFPEAVFAALGDEASAVAGVFVVKFFFVFIANGRAVDDHAGALDRLFGLEGWDPSPFR